MNLSHPLQIGVPGHLDHMKEFKYCLSDKIATHINAQKVPHVSAAAILAEEYVLTHRESLGAPSPTDSAAKARPVCTFCKSMAT